MDSRRKDTQLGLMRDYLMSTDQQHAVFSPSNLISFRANSYIAAKKLGLQLSSRTFVCLLTMRDKIVLSKQGPTVTPQITKLLPSYQFLYPTTPNPYDEPSDNLRPN